MNYSTFASTPPCTFPGADCIAIWAERQTRRTTADGLRSELVTHPTVAASHMQGDGVNPGPVVSHKALL